jgi:hypothetical protein
MDTDAINRENALHHAQADADSARIEEGRQRCRAHEAERQLRLAQKELTALREELGR